jgi:hypothetical protein
MVLKLKPLARVDFKWKIYFYFFQMLFNDKDII